MQVAISHSNPDISHGAHSSHDTDLDSETIGVAPDLSDSWQDFYSKTRNSEDECGVCSIEVSYFLLLQYS